MVTRQLACGLLLTALLQAPGGADAGAPGGGGLALSCAKALVCSADAESGVQVVDRAVVLVRDGRIEAVGRAADTPVPPGYEHLDVGERWIMPGMIDLHSHVGGRGGLNDTVYQANPGLRIACSVQPLNPNLARCLAAGVTTVLFIPGSGSNVGGVGVLIKTGHARYEDALLRFPGSLKVAQGDNPTRWGYGMGRAFMNWVIRDVYRRGLEYAAEGPAGTGQHDPDPQFEIFEALLSRQAQITAHTQVPQLVYATLRLAVEEFDLPLILDHSTIGGYRYAFLAERLGVAAICGPRSVDTPRRSMINWAQSDREGFRGVAAGWQEAGLEAVGFNTDAPVIPAEDLFLQAAVGVRYGMDDSALESVRGLTIVPAMAAGIAGRVGSLEAGKDADLLVIQGHPADPRSAVDLVLIDGVRVYDAEAEARRY